MIDATCSTGSLHAVPRHAQPCLVTLGGWFNDLGTPELRAVADGTVEMLGPRLARVDDTPVNLQRLGGGRAVFAFCGATSTPGDVPEAVTRRLIGSYAIRFHDMAGRLCADDRKRLVDSVWRRLHAPRVDLDNPDHDVHVFVTADRLLFGERIVDCAPELRRGLDGRPFRRSYEMPPRKARMLVNLSGARPGVAFIDPFCGAGSLVIEAARIGSRAVGSDRDGDAVSGARRNARHEGVSASFFHADALHPATRGNAFAAAATDLPYGRSASRHKMSGPDLYTAFLDAFAGTAAPDAGVLVVTRAGAAPTRTPEGWEHEWSLRDEGRTITRDISRWRLR